MPARGSSIAKTPGRVLFVVDSLGLSGKTKALVDLACGLDPNRFTAIVCALRHEDSVIAARLRKQDIPIETLATPDGLAPGTVWKLAKLIRKEKCTIVHCYNPRPMLYGGLAARLAGVRAVLASLSAFACQVPDREYAFLPQALMTESIRNRRRNQIAAAMARYLVAVSQTLGERFFVFNHLSLAKLRVIQYGVDLDALRAPTPEEIQAFRNQVGVRNGEILAGSVSRLTEQKDFPTMLRAFAKAQGEYPKMRLVIAGSGQEEALLKTLTGELGIAERVKFLGHCDQVPLVMQSLDIFLMTSKFEPYGIAVLEAKGAARAIAATRVNEVPELLREGECGLLSPPEDPDSFADCILRLARDPALRKCLAQRALDDALAHHSLQSLINGYQQLYDEMLNS
jgi:glycosyltransferase involved in cell wall biosynthesis